jgi:hypothetical protein
VVGCQRGCETAVHQRIPEPPFAHGPGQSRVHFQVVSDDPAHAIVHTIAVPKWLHSSIADRHAGLPMPPGTQRLRVAASAARTGMVRIPAP